MFLIYIYIYIYIFINLLNDTTGVSSTSGKTESKISYGPAERETNSSKVKSNQEKIKWKSKFTNCSSRENDKKRKKFMHDNWGRWKRTVKKKMTKEEREMRDNLDKEKIIILKKRG